MIARAVAFDRGAARPAGRAPISSPSPRATATSPPRAMPWLIEELGRCGRGRRRRPAARCSPARIEEIWYEPRTAGVPARRSTADAATWSPWPPPPPTATCWSRTTTTSPLATATIWSRSSDVRRRSGDPHDRERHLDQRRVERRRSVAHRQRAVAERRAGRHPTRAPGARDAPRHARSTGMVRYGAAPRSRLLATTTCSRRGRRRRQRRGLRHIGRDDRARRRRPPRPHEPLRL